MVLPDLTLTCFLYDSFQAKNIFHVMVYYICFPKRRKSNSNDINAQYNAHKSNKDTAFVLRNAE